MFCHRYFIIGSSAWAFRDKVVRLRESRIYIVWWFYTDGRVVGLLCNWDMNVQFLIKLVYHFLDRRARRVLGA